MCLRRGEYNFLQFFYSVLGDYLGREEQALGWAGQEELMAGRDPVGLVTRLVVWTSANYHFIDGLIQNFQQIQIWFILNAANLACAVKIQEYRVQT